MPEMSELSKVRFHREQTLRQICIHEGVIEESFERMYMRHCREQEWLEEVVYCDAVATEWAISLAPKSLFQIL